MARKRGQPHDDDAEEDDRAHRDREPDDAMDDDDAEHDRRGRPRRSRKKKFQIMSSSDQTEADRRVLRRRQRTLQNDIALGVAGGDAAAKGAAAGEVMQLRGQNNALWDQVHYTREAVLDSENVDLIANKAAREAEKIIQVPRYDAIRMAQSLVKKGTVRQGASSEFDWHGLGFQVGVCFNALPCHASFLYGALDAEYTPKERKKPERRQKQTQVESENEEEEQPEDVDQTGRKKQSDGNELSAVEKHIRVIRKTLHARHGEEREAALDQVAGYEARLVQAGEDERAVNKKTKKFVREKSQADAVRALFNPKSFTQTVENIFHFSFLVKEGFSGIRARSAEEAKECGGAPGPVIRPIKDGEKLPLPKQAILSLNMQDWKDMCHAYEVLESDVPHRVDGKVAAKKEKKGRKSK